VSAAGTGIRPASSPGFSVSFQVDGDSVSQGSLTAVPTNRNWRTVPGVRWTLKDAKPALKPWRKKVAAAAAEAMAGRPLLEGPVHVTAIFVFSRPQVHFRAGGALKTTAPWNVTSHQKGDLDKHLRSVLDALTGEVYADDSQVASARARKVYGNESYIWVEVNQGHDLHSPGVRV
jgi:Holliday junction resolvase RusA-like endonuclease